MTLRTHFAPKASPAAWFVGGLMVGAALSVPFFERDLEIMLRWVDAAREDAWLRWWGDFASRTCFEGGAVGAKDISHFFVALVLAAYGLSFRQAFGPRRFAWRAWATYYMACLLTFFAVNRGMKLFFGRARPSEVLRGVLDFTPLWSIGNYDFLDALSKGSFASGHTTTSMVLLPLAFLALGGGRSAGTVPLFVLALGWGAFAGWGRVITGAHYPSDIVWAVVVCVWVCVLVRECLFPAKAPPEHPGLPAGSLESCGPWSGSHWVSSWFFFPLQGSRKQSCASPGGGH